MGRERRHSTDGCGHINSGDKSSKATGFTPAPDQAQDSRLVYCKEGLSPNGATDVTITSDLETPDYNRLSFMLGFAPGKRKT